MKILVDQNHLLVVENPNIPKLKEYEYNTSGYCFCDYDKGIVVYHKKHIKIVNLKNLWDNMSVFYVKDKSQKAEGNLDKDCFDSALSLFNGFDEHIWESYCYIPRIKKNEVFELNRILNQLWLPIKIKQTEKWFLVNFIEKNGLQFIKVNDIEWNLQIISFLFGLVLTYGKMEIKNWELLSIKAHIPLFGQWVKYKDFFDDMIKELVWQGLFLSTSIVQNGDGIIYQINSSDYELLEYFVHFYQSVEKIEKIFKRDFTQEVKSMLIYFLQTNTEIPEHGKEEVLSLIEDGVIKILNN
jgi:hypothetical protein